MYGEGVSLCNGQIRKRWKVQNIQVGTIGQHSPIIPSLLPSTKTKSDSVQPSGQDIQGLPERNYSFAGIIAPTETMICVIVDKI